MVRNLLLLLLSSKSEKLLQQLQKLQAIPVRLSTCTYALRVSATPTYNEVEVQDVSGTRSLKHAQNLCNARSKMWGSAASLIPDCFWASNCCKLLVGGCLCYQAFHRKSRCCMPSASWHATEAADSWTSTDCSRVEAASNVFCEFAHGGRQLSSIQQIRAQMVQSLFTRASALRSWNFGYRCCSCTRYDMRKDNVCRCKSVTDPCMSISYQPWLSALAADSAGESTCWCRRGQSARYASF